MGRLLYAFGAAAFQAWFVALAVVVGVGWYRVIRRRSW